MTGRDEPLVRARRLAKRYGAGEAMVTALIAASFELGTGEFTAVMGPSGSGKSTLLNLVGLLDAPSGGTLRIAGTDMARCSSDEYARVRSRHIGFVFQSYHLLPRHSALANVELPLMYQGVRRKDRRRRAARALDQVALSKRRHAYPAQLSGGEQQRVAIARALVTDPDLIIADEPTGALDTATSEQVIALLQKACSEGCAVLLVTHDPDVAAWASRVISIRDGTIVDDARNASSPPAGTAGRASRSMRVA